MNFDVLSALLVFAFATTVSPGPNNMMLLVSGANFGFARSVPHMLGIAFGIVAMVLALGVGLMPILEQHPWLSSLLKLLCVGYMLYLVWKIVQVTPDALTTEQRAKPMSFSQAALFQVVNPKAWSMALTAITIYSPARSLDSVIMVAAAFCLVSFPSTSIWVVIGEKLQRLLSSARHLQVFNWVMASLLVASLYPMITV